MKRIVRKHKLTKKEAAKDNQIRKDVEKEFPKAFPEQLDITAPEIVEILVRDDGAVIWVNVDGICRLRIYQIKPGALEVNDERKSGAKN